MNNVVMPSRYAVVVGAIAAVITYAGPAPVVTADASNEVNPRIVAAEVVPTVAATLVSAEYGAGEDAVDSWIISQIDEEPDAVPENESDLVPIQWEHGRGFVERG